MARGRGKVKVAFLHSESNRRACYKTRKKGLLKKVSELSVLCGVDVCAIIHSPFGDEREPETFPPSRDAVLKIIKRFEDLSTSDRSKRMLDSKGFARQETEKIKERMKKVERSNRLKEMGRLVDHRLIDGEWNRALELVDLRDIDNVLTYRINDITERMLEIKPNQAQGIAVAPAPVPALALATTMAPPARLQVGPVLTAQDKGKGIMVTPAPALAPAPVLQMAPVTAHQQMSSAPAPLQMAPFSAHQQMQYLSSAPALTTVPLEGTSVLTAQDKGKGVMVAPALAPAALQMASVSSHQQMQCMSSAPALTQAPLQMAPVSAHQQMQNLSSAPLQVASVSGHQEIQNLPLTPYEQTVLDDLWWEDDVWTPSMFNDEAGPSLINFDF